MDLKNPLNLCVVVLLFRHILNFVWEIFRAVFGGTLSNTAMQTSEIMTLMIRFFGNRGRL